MLISSWSCRDGDAVKVSGDDVNWSIDTLRSEGKCPDFHDLQD
jgi:hypothetical protein